jgi:hypothetical protein
MMKLAWFFVATSAFASYTWTNGVGGPSSSLPATHDGTHAVTYTITCSAGAGVMQDLYDVIGHPSTPGDTQYGDTVLLDSACTWYQSSQNPVTIWKPGGTTGYVTIATTQFAKLPSVGTRVTLAYTPLMPTLQVDNSSYFFSVVGGGAVPADRIKFVGLHGKGLTTGYASAFIKTGKAQTGAPCKDQSRGWDETKGCTGSTMPGYGFDADYVDGRVNGSVSPGTCGSPCVLPVKSASNRGIQAGQRIWVGGFTGFTSGTANGEYQTVASATSSSLTLVSTLVNSYSDNAAIYVMETATSQMPDDIIVQHCIFDNPGAGEQFSRYISHFSKKLTVNDSYFDGIWISNSKDSQNIGGTTTQGPLYLSNNHIASGSELIMYGGDLPGIDIEPDAGYIYFNWFGRYPERERLGPWCQTQPNPTSFSDCSGDAGRDYGVNNITGNPRLIFPGRQIFNSTYGAFTATNTTPALVGTTEPNWNISIGATVTDGAVTWRRDGSGYQKLSKNNFELKNGKNFDVAYNSFDWYGDMYNYNGNQAQIINVKGAVNPTDGLLYCTSGHPSWSGSGFNCNAPYPMCGANDTWGKLYNGTPQPCYRARTFGITFRNNLIKGFSGGFFLIGSQGSYQDPVYMGNYLIQNNLMLQTEKQISAQVGVYHVFTFSPSWTLSGGYTGAGIPGWIKIKNNTVYSPYSIPRSVLYVDASMTQGVSFPNSANEVSGNIFPHSATGVNFNSGYTGSADDIGTLGMFPNNSANWKKNVALGARTTTASYPANSTFNNSGGTAAYSPGDWDFVLTSDGLSGHRSTKLLRDYGSSDFKVATGHSFAWRGVSDGSDVGADVSQVPQIRNLSVTPTDRAALFQWLVTQPIKSTPCVVEVNSQEDFYGTWGGELANIGTYYRQDADDTDRNYRDGLRRMAIVGHTVNLAANTTYYYRLSCGGDLKRGQFTTLATLAGTSTLRSSQQTASAMTVGTTYSRTSDTIGSTVSTSCASNACTATVNRGQIYYERIGSGSVRAVAIQ